MKLKLDRQGPILRKLTASGEINQEIQTTRHVPRETGSGGAHARGCCLGKGD